MQISSVAPPSGTAGARTSGLGSDLQVFLRMLTTQIQYQDPLNPMESSEFAVQLATFSGVEQQTRTNQLLEALGGQMNTLGMAQLAGWIGMEARVTTPVHFDGAPISLFVAAPALADRAVLVVRDSTGAEVARETVPPQGGEVLWAGTDASGAPRAKGIYRFSLESYAGDDLIGSADVPAYGQVTEARVGVGGAVEIVMRGGVTTDARTVTALRRPQ